MPSPTELRNLLIYAVCFPWIQVHCNEPTSPSCSYKHLSVLFKSFKNSIIHTVFCVTSLNSVQMVKFCTIVLKSGSIRIVNGIPILNVSKSYNGEKFYVSLLLFLLVFLSQHLTDNRQ